MIGLKGKQAMVIGLGVTGRAVANFLRDRGARLVLCERKELEPAGDLPPGAKSRIGEEQQSWLDGIDLVIPSPGVPRDNLLLRGAVARGIPVWSEPELASKFFDRPFIAITGTNGKSTVTSMIGAILEAAGRKVFVGGNLGRAFIDSVSEDYEIAVVEISSFQLEWTDTFRPHVGVHLNLTDDHLYRYRDLEEYGEYKARLFAQQTASDWAILNSDDPHVWKLKAKLQSRVIGFGMARQDKADAIWPANNGLQFDIAGRRGKIDLSGYKLPGRHNLSNAMASAAAALAAGAETHAIEAALAAFKALPHRIEHVRDLDGVSYFDDSKGTNVDAVVQAIDAVPAPIILIAGGVDKGGDYSPLLEPLRKKVRLVVLMGEAREKMHSVLKGTTALEVVPGLTQAVEVARKQARPGDHVLLSPACASFDQFRDYEERGRVYQELVRAL